MEELQLLAAALGLSAFAGINLYLTVFVVSAAIQFQWITLGPEYESLLVLGHPVIMILAGAFYFLEFFADKVPWVDTAWDAVHTAIRPIGAAFLGIVVLGETHPVGEVVAALLCGSVALSTHLTKAGTRLFVNASPEPVSNSVVSIAEDLMVVGGLAFVYHYPWLAGLLALGALGLFIYLAPKFYRHGLALFSLIIGKIKALFPGADRVPQVLVIDMQDRERDRLPKFLQSGETLWWGLPAFAGRGCGVPLQSQGHLVGVRGRTAKIGWMAKGRDPKWIKLSEVMAHRKNRFLYDEIEFVNDAQHVVLRVRFRKDRAGQVTQILDLCQEHQAVATSGEPAPTAA
ncbi:MAG: hypothetical protein OHK005_08410 [Candidatus Methylacidiphilales bacterium]